MRAFLDFPLFLYELDLEGCTAFKCGYIRMLKQEVDELIFSFPAFGATPVKNHCFGKGLKSTSRKPMFLLESQRLPRECRVLFPFQLRSTVERSHEPAFRRRGRKRFPKKTAKLTYLSIAGGRFLSVSRLECRHTSTANWLYSFFEWELWASTLSFSC